MCVCVCGCDYVCVWWSIIARGEERFLSIQLGDREKKGREEPHGNRPMEWYQGWWHKQYNLFFRRKIFHFENFVKMYFSFNTFSFRSFTTFNFSPILDELVLSGPLNSLTSKQCFEVDPSVCDILSTVTPTRVNVIRTSFVCDRKCLLTTVKMNLNNRTYFLQI